MEFIFVQNETNYSLENNTLPQALIMLAIVVYIILYVITLSTEMHNSIM